MSGSATLFEGSSDARATCPTCSRRLRPLGTPASGTGADGRRLRYYTLPTHGPVTARCLVRGIAVDQVTGTTYDARTIPA